MRPALPDCSLSALRQGALTPSQRNAFAREAARASARHLHGGGNLSNLDETKSHLQNGRLFLSPPSAGGGPLGRGEVETQLLALRERWKDVLGGAPALVRFLAGFRREMTRLSPGWRDWSRVWVRELEQREHLRRVRQWHAHLDEGPIKRDGVTGHWRGSVPATPEGMLASIRAFQQEGGECLSRSPRADVWRGQLLGEEVILKSFAPNPRAWRRRLETSRARQSWAGSMTVWESGLPCPEPLGFLERLENGIVIESHVVHRWIPGVTPFRKWLTHQLPRLSATQRAGLRHDLRRKITTLHQHGLYHRDLKLLNLLVRGETDLLEWWWIDLEDIRAAKTTPFWNVVRNFYQINSSVPKRITREERQAFAKGFTSRHPLATSPLVLKLVETKTRKRLQLEVRRLRRVKQKRGLSDRLSVFFHRHPCAPPIKK